MGPPVSSRISGQISGRLLHAWQELAQPIAVGTSLLTCFLVPDGEVEGSTLRPTTQRLISVAALILMVSIVGFILAVIFDWPGLARFGGPPSRNVTLSDIMQGTLTSIPLPPMIALAIFALLARSRRWWGTLAVVALCLLGVLFFVAALAELQPNPYVPLAALVGAVVAYGILGLLLVLSGVIDLIDRARQRRRVSGVR
jgi:hypothetical protein